MSALVNGDRSVPWATSLATAAPLAPLKYEVTINARVLQETTDPQRPLRYIDIGSVDSLGAVSAMEEFTFGNAPSRARRLPRAGDTIVSTVRTYLRAISYVADDPLLVCSTGFAVITPGQRLHPKYLAYWMRSDPIVDEICARSTGVSYPAINASEIGCLPVPMLPIERQRGVASFLDRKTAAIDALIAKKERLIELLQEKRQALITQAVTKGLDPNVPMKDSSVPWVGTIPAHWEVHQLRRAVARFIDYRGRTPTKVDEGVPLITAGAVRDGRIDHARAPEYMLREEYAEFMRRGMPEIGDVVFTTEAPLGEVAQVTDTSMAFAQRIILFKVERRRIRSDFLWLYYRGEPGRHEVISRASGSTAEGIRADRLRASLVLVPPIEEQSRIVQYVTVELGRIEPIRGVVESQLAKLREYRQALITAAVTGKIDVSNEAA